ncbi:hypothetical protein CGCF413_v000512 [Colletotrichum fructicola]|nr:hypothetical protein CGCF413_v000512 [Colletotrichum fructicola]
MFATNRKHTLSLRDMFTRGCIHTDGCQQAAWTLPTRGKNGRLLTRRSTTFLSLDHNQTTGIVDSRTAP